jgi:RNA polymerase sigma factor for flagellar operon FliA
MVNNNAQPSTQDDIHAAAMRVKMQQAYGRQNRAAMEEKWILDHLPLVKHIVLKVAYHARGRLEQEDLISAGTLGLVKAAKSFDPTRDVEFKTYAYIRIRGAVIDEMRGNTFVPAAVHQQIREIEATYRMFTTDHGRAPSDEELAAEVGLPLEKMYKILEEARRQNFLSIHGLNEDQPGLPALAPIARGLSPDDEAEQKELLESLTAAILDLPQRDRHVLMLYYERDLTMKETAEVLGVTESRVSQLHAAALFKLSMKLGNAI